MKRSKHWILVFVTVLFSTPLFAQTGTITADPNPCEVYLMQDLCTARITWSTQGASYVQVWVQGSGAEQLFAASGGGGPVYADAPWISQEGGNYVFRLYDYSSGSRGALLGSVTVTAFRSLRCEPL